MHLGVYVRKEMTMKQQLGVRSHETNEVTPQLVSLYVSNSQNSQRVMYRYLSDVDN